ncbi:hypothetical protein GCK72_015524 [Caenorhabditis remanei]|uniref:Uncharacterized protein n=1 Tax=Caenorhabditis remanei TaxID=31234 RepID=A0A6A5GWQ4_CAERE|nr:hypothetical protein GCK72_015524 [Caenorhabditis remanei]KAF1759064.1 hypothetical protein GCK72_015524 [Caenorhabditis remanei]
MLATVPFLLFTREGLSLPQTSCYGIMMGYGRYKYIYKTRKPRYNYLSIVLGEVAGFQQELVEVDDFVDDRCIVGSEFFVIPTDLQTLTTK